MHVKEILEKQRNFYHSQKTKDPKFRIKSLKQFLVQLQEVEPLVNKALKADLGKSDFEAYLTEFNVIKGEAKKMINALALWSQPKRVKASLLNFPSRDYLLPEPYGCCLQISPWNYPFQLSLATLIGAVAAGNTVVLKPSEHAPETSKLLAELIAKSFAPEHVCVVEGGAEAAKTLLKERWDHITFTGSTTIGKIVAKAAAEHLTPTLLELGGKNPCIIDDTAPVALTAKRIVWGKYLNCGQTCIAPDYLLVDKKIKDDLVLALKKEIKAAYGEDAEASPSYGRIAHRKHFDRLVHLIQDVALEYGGKSNPDTLYLEPTILEVKDTTHPSMQDEIFGPILPIISYSNEKEIDEIVSHYEHPLGFYVFSKRKKFIQSLLERYSFGGGVVNDSMIQFVNDQLPFGGIGHSGMGAYHGKNSFDAYTHYKPVIKRGLWLDPSVRYAPYPSSFGWLKKLLNLI